MSKIPKTKGHKKALLKVDNPICGLCKRPITHPEAVTIDHIIPLSMGGKNYRSNVQLAHATCNRRKANLPFMPKSLSLQKQLLKQFAPQKGNK